MDYKTYIRSDKWREFCRKARVAAGLKCQRCGANNKILETHHMHYNTLGRETLADVEVLCRDCHPKADRERERRDGLSTYIEKKHGLHYIPSASEYDDLADEFDEWTDRKDGFF